MQVIENLTKWQNYVHYFLNSAMLITEMLLIKFSLVDWKSFLLVAVLILINDTLIHLAFSVLPEKFRWSD